MLNWTLGFLVCGLSHFLDRGFGFTYTMRFGVFPVTVGKICSSTTSIVCTSSLILLAVFEFDRNLLRFCGFLVFFVRFCGFLYTPLPPPCLWTMIDLSLASFVRPSAAFVFTAVIHFLEIENGTLPRSGYVYWDFSSTKRELWLVAFWFVYPWSNLSVSRPTRPGYNSTVVACDRYNSTWLLHV